MNSYRIKFTHSIVCLVTSAEDEQKALAMIDKRYPGNIVEWIEDRETGKQVYNVRDVVPFF